MIFFLFNAVIGIKNGFIKSVFISFGFVIKAVATYFIFRIFSDRILSDENSLMIINSIKSVLIRKAPNLVVAEDLLNKIILILFIYIFASIVVFVVYKILKDIADNESLKLSDQMAGCIYGLLKSTIIIMLLIYFVDKGSDYLFTFQLKSELSESKLLPLIYEYNIFLNMF